MKISPELRNDAITIEGISQITSRELIQNIDILEDYINKEFNGTLKIRFWDDKKYTVSEIYNPLTSKGNGIKQIMEYYNIPKEKTIAIGDGHNDIELFQETNICPS